MIDKGLTGLTAVIAAHKDAKAKGLGRGHPGVGEIPCPICIDGKIKYSVASINGHIWGCCSTKDCVRWME